METREDEARGFSRSAPEGAKSGRKGRYGGVFDSGLGRVLSRIFAMKLFGFLQAPPLNICGRNS